MEKKLLDILICPVCKQALEENKDNDSLLCYACKLVFPVRDGIPVMLADEAEPLSKVGE